MSGLTQNYLKGYIIGSNQFNFQDARVDDFETDLDYISNVIDRTQGQQGIEVRNDRFVLSNGGYYDDAAVFELVNQSIRLENDGDVEYEHDFTQIDDAAYLDWIKDGNTVGIFVMATDGGNEYGYQFDGHFEEDRDEAGTYHFGVDNGAPTDYGINDFSVYLDETTPQYLFYIRKDERNENTLTIQELAMYLPQFVAQPFPGDMIEAGDGIIASGSGLRIDTNWLEQYLADNFGLTPSNNDGL